MMQFPILGNGSIRIPFERADGTRATVVYIPKFSAAAVLPYDAAKEGWSEVHWSIRRPSGHHDFFVVASVGNSLTGEGFLFLTRHSDGRTLCIDQKFHAINESPDFFPFLRKNGQLYFPTTRQVFDTQSFDACLADPLAGNRLLRGTPEAGEPGGPPGPLESDSWIRNTLLWDELDSYRTAEEMYRRLEQELRSETPETRREAQAACRFLLGGAAEVIQRTNRPDETRELSDKDYLEAVRTERESLRRDLVSMNLRLWFLHRDPNFPQRYLQLALLIEQRFDPVLTRIAEERIESLLGGREEVARLAGVPSDSLTHDHYARAARKKVETFTGTPPASRSRPALAHLAGNICTFVLRGVISSGPETDPLRN